MTSNTDVDVGNQVISKKLATTRDRHNDPQQQSNEFIVQYGLGKVIEMNKIHICKVGHELCVLVFDRLTVQKPFRVENNIIHKTSVTDCLNREMTYKSPVYVCLSFWIFSERDPRLIENKIELIDKLKKTIRMASKAKRIREEPFELSAVHNIERKRRNKRHFSDISSSDSNSVSAQDEWSDDEEDMVLTGMDGNANDPTKQYSETFDTEDPRYKVKLLQGYQECRLGVEDCKKYKYLLEKTTWPKHTLIELPVMPDSVLCHSVDDVSKNQGCMYSSGGNFIINGRERPWIMSLRSKFSTNFLHKDSNAVENRSGHRASSLRASSSTLSIIPNKEKKTNRLYVAWKIPYVKFEVPWGVLFKGCGIIDDENIKGLVLNTVVNYFRDGRDLPMKQIVELVDNSLLHQSRNSDEIKTQEDAWIYIGKLSDANTDEEIVQELIAGPDTSDKEEKMSDTIKRQRKKKYTKSSSTSTATIESIARDQRNEWLRKGRATIFKEILPQVMADTKFSNDYKSWPDKAYELSKMSAKLLFDQVRQYTADPENFMPYDNRDLNMTATVQLMHEWLLCTLIRPILANHIKMATRGIYSAMFHENPIDPKTFLDHKRPTNRIDEAISTGIIRPGAGIGQQPFQGLDKKSTQQNNNNNKQANDRTGITQLQNNTNVFSIWSMQSRLSRNIASAGNITNARKIWDHWGVVDFTETPDNKACGMVNPQALFSQVSIEPVDESLITDVILPSFPHVPINQFLTAQEFVYNNGVDTDHKICVNVNGRPLMKVTSKVAQDICNYIRPRRYALMGNTYLGISNNLLTNDLNVNTTGGRSVRPLFVTSKSKRLLEPTNSTNSRPLYQSMTWDMMLREGFIEYIDKQEESNDTLILTNMNDMVKLIKLIEAKSPEEQIKLMNECPFTHCEVSLLLIMGICSSQIPFLQQNQAPRNSFGSGMLKQAMAGPLMNTAVRLDTMMHTLCFSSLPLVRTATLNWYGAESSSPGCMNYTAFIPLKGKTPEDAFIFNAGSIGRGIGRSEQTSVMTVTERKTNSVSIGNTERFQRANRLNTIGMKTQAYDHLDIDGAPFPGTLVSDKHIIISRVGALDDPNYKKHDEKEKRLLQQSGMKHYDTSTICLPKFSGIVQKTILTSDYRGQRKFRVQIKKVCPPLKGDKFCLTGDHDVLTQFGWKNITQLNSSDRIASMDEETHTKLEYRVATEIVSFEHLGDLYVVDSPDISLVTTMNHKMWVSCQELNHIHQGKQHFELIEALSILDSGIPSITYQKNIQFNDVQMNFPFMINGDSEAYRPLLFDTYQELGKWLVVIGFLINSRMVEILPGTSNYTSQTTLKRNLKILNVMMKNAKELGIYFNANINQETSLIKYVMVSLPLDGSENSRKSLNWQNWFQIHKDMTCFGIDRWIGTLNGASSRLLFKILTATWSSDICHDENKDKHNHTTLKIYADIIQQLALQSGQSVDIIKNNNYHGVNTQDLYKIVIHENQDQYKPRVNSDEHTSVLNHIFTRVYCVTIPSHVFYVRRNGKACWTGNSSRHAQKVTVGHVSKETDMIFTKNGLIPDTVINPHCIPSRMTGGQISEVIGGKTALVYGEPLDGTAFSKAYKNYCHAARRDYDYHKEIGIKGGDISIGDIRAEENTEDDAADSIMRTLGDFLQRRGHNRHGTDIFYHGESGERLGKTGSKNRGAGEIFWGPVFWYKLTHRCEDKLHSRANGPRHILTRQPVDGGASIGYRCGEMEAHSIMCYGASYLLLERHFLVSDCFRTHICTKCGLNYQPLFKDKMFFCNRCGSDQNCGSAPLTYTFKLLVQKLQSANLFPRYQSRRL